MINISLEKPVTIKYTYIVQIWRYVDFLIRGFSCNMLLPGDGPPSTVVCCVN